MIKFKVIVADDIDISRFTGSVKKGEMFIADQMAKDTEPYVPALTGAFTRMTRVLPFEGHAAIVYSGPQARYLWYGKRMVNEATGKGPAYIPTVGYRWPKGARLIPTEQDLNFTQQMHPKAQARWFDASKAQNLEKWARQFSEALEL